MFASIRNKIASMIATGAVVQANNILQQAAFQPEVKTTLVNGRPIPGQTFKKTQNLEGVEGWIGIDCISGLSSDTLRKSLMGKLVYSAVAVAWNAHITSLGRKSNPSLTKRAEITLQDAAEAVSRSDSLGFGVSLTVESFAFLLMTGVPAQITENNAKLLADITGADPKELHTKREAQRAAKYQSNLEQLQNFLDSIASCSGVHLDAMGEVVEVDAKPKLKGASVISGLANCVEFVTTWNDPVRMAAELTLINHDRSIIDHHLKLNARRDESQAPDYVRAIDEQLLDARGMAAGMSAGK